jgi:SAM-dependent methyltransferase
LPALALIAVADNLFALAELDALLREELAGVAEVAARRPAGRALVVQASAVNRELPLDLRHLAALRLHVADARLEGDVSCAADALPFEDEAFQLVLVQHADEVLGLRDGLAAEAARVLVPGGVLLWCGLNPWSPWLAWVRWRSGEGVAAPRVSPADSMRRCLLRSGLVPGTVDRVGGCWPRAASSGVPRNGLAAPLRGAWSIAATKRREVLTPLRPRNARERIAINPSLAAPSRRASA